MSFRPLIWIGVVVSCCGAAWSQSAATGLFAEANDLYRRGQYEAARERYMQVADSGIADVRLFYNLGNACFKSDLLGESLVWFERAHRLDPRDADVLANLRFARQVKRDREPTATDNALTRLIVATFDFPTVDELSVVSAFALLGLFAAGAGSWAWPRVGRRTWLAVLVASAGVWLLSGVFLGARVYRLETRTDAIVTVDEATARSGPAKDQTPVFVVHEGTKLRIERRESEWFLVRLPNGRGGWMLDDALMAI